MAATATHRITIPKKVSELLVRRAKTEKTTISGAVLSMIEDAVEYAEEGHIWELALERKRTSAGEKRIPLSEVWSSQDDV